MKNVVQLDDDGYFVGLVVADESPLEAGVFLIPAGCLDIEKPLVPDGQKAKWVGHILEPISSRVQGSKI